MIIIHIATQITLLIILAALCYTLEWLTIRHTCWHCGNSYKYKKIKLTEYISAESGYKICKDCCEKNNWNNRTDYELDMRNLKAAEQSDKIIMMKKLLY